MTHSKKIGANLLFTNDTSFGVKMSDGSMCHIYIEELADILNEVALNNGKGGLNMKIPSSVEIVEKYVSALVVEESETGKMHVMKHREGLRTLESVDILSLEKIDAYEIDLDDPMKYHGKRLLVVV